MGHQCPREPLGLLPERLRVLLQPLVAGVQQAARGVALLGRIVVAVGGVRREKVRRQGCIRSDTQVSAHGGIDDGGLPWVWQRRRPDLPDDELDGRAQPPITVRVRRVRLDLQQRQAGDARVGDVGRRTRLALRVPAPVVGLLGGEGVETAPDGIAPCVRVHGPRHRTWFRDLGGRVAAAVPGALRRRLPAGTVPGADKWIWILIRPRRFEQRHPRGRRPPPAPHSDSSRGRGRLSRSPRSASRSAAWHPPAWAGLHASSDVER